MRLLMALPLCGSGRDFVCLRLLVSPSSRRSCGTCKVGLVFVSTFLQDSALFFSFALQLTVVIMRAAQWLSSTARSEPKPHPAKRQRYLPRLGLILRTRRGPWQTYLLLGAFWCCSVLLTTGCIDPEPSDNTCFRLPNPQISRGKAEPMDGFP